MSAQRKFLGNALTLASGNIVAQIITISLVPVITRIYSPEAFGYFSIFLSVAIMITAVSSLRYSAAILLPDEHADAKAIVVLSLAIVLVMALICLVVIIFLGDAINSLMGLGKAPYLLMLVPLSVLLGGTWLVLNMWNVRQSRFRNLAGARVASAIVDRTTSILLGVFVFPGPLGLVLGNLCGQAALLAGLFAGSAGSHEPGPDSSALPDRILPVAKRYRRFPKFAWSSLVQQLSAQAPVILLGMLFSPAIAGFYALGKRVLLQPINIIGDALAKSFFQRVSADYRSGKDVSGVTIKLLHALAVFFIPPMMMFSTVAEPLFRLVFGNEWIIAGYYATLLTPMFISVFLLLPFSVFFDLLEKQKELGTFNLFTLVTTIVVLVGGSYIHKADITILVYSAVSTLIIINRVLWLASHAGVAVLKVLAILAGRVAIAALFSMPLLMMRMLAGAGDIVLVLSALVFVVSYFVYLWRFDSVAHGIMSHGLSMRGRIARA